MGYEAQAKEIGELTVQVTPLPFLEAIKMKRKLLGIAGKNFKSLMKVVEGLDSVDSIESIMKSEFDFSKIGDFIEDVLESLPEKDIIQLINDFSRGMVVDNVAMDSEESVRDMTFAGKTGSFYEAMGFFLEVNYSDFLALLKKKFFSKDD